MRCVLLVIFILSATSITHGLDYRYYLGATGGFSTISGGDSAKYTIQNSFGINFGYRFKERWLLDFNLSLHNNFNDTTAASSFSIGGDETNADRKWQAKRIGVSANHLLFETDNRLNISLGLGGGLMVWKIIDPVGDTTINTLGIHNETVDYSASEIYFTLLGGFNYTLTSKWSISWNFHTDYLSGAGAEFASPVKSARENWQVGSFISLNLHFGSFYNKTPWKSNKSWSSQIVKQKPLSTTELDSDGDGVIDAVDRCLETPDGVIVDKNGCSLDSDGDGVSDGLDDCPNTDQLAFGLIDIFGCPIDSDFDGYPDYIDQCPFNQTGAHVDEKGCPVDSDADGVPDGLDDCPNSLYGVEVDRFGCIELSMLSKPMVLNIDYASGSFEIDPNNRERIKELARILNFVPDIKLEIYGYTDNIGTTVANKKLSQKRGRRVRDYLATLGIEKERIKVFGKGETNFIASNNTAKGRAKNRRIEIIFYK